jgi:transcriptional regulator with XRE-family HTH domain
MSRQQDRSRRLARYVAARRDALGLSQAALADQAGLDPKTVHTLETGKHWPVTKTRRALEPALGWTEGDFERIADGGFPATGPLPEDDPDGVVAAAMAGASSDDLEARIRAVIADLPEQHRPLVEELYEQLLDSERQRRRLLEKIVPLPQRDASDGDAVAGEPSNGNNGAVV